MELAAVAFNIFLSLLVGYILLRNLRAFWIDTTRNELFALRDALFLYAVDNDLVDHPAHRELRNLANTFIRYAPIVSYARVALLTVLGKLFPQKPNERLAALRRSIAALPEEHRGRFEQTHALIAIEMFKHLYRGSLFLRAAYFLSLPIAWINGASAPTPNSRQIELVEVDALSKCAA